MLGSEPAVPTATPVTVAASSEVKVDTSMMRTVICDENYEFENQDFSGVDIVECTGTRGCSSGTFPSVVSAAYCNGFESCRSINHTAGSTYWTWTATAIGRRRARTRSRATRDTQ